MWSFNPPPPPPQPSSFSFYPPAHHPHYPPQNINRSIPTHNSALSASGYYDFGHRPALPRPFNPIDAPRPPAPTYYEALSFPGPAEPHYPPFSQNFLDLPPGPHAAIPRTPPTPSTAMPPPKRRRAAPHASSSNTQANGSAAAMTTPAPAAPTPKTPVQPCANGRCHFHRLRCGHVVKTPLTDPPAFCATNCVTAPAAADPAETFGPAPFECPVCVARTLSLLWKMDVVRLFDRQMSDMAFADFARWVHDNYVAAWEKRKVVRLAEWMGPAAARRACGQLSVRERACVVWMEGEARAPYGIEEFRRVYERREVKQEFWAQTYRDNTLGDEDGGEAYPGVVVESVEKPGVDFPAEWEE